MSAFRRRASVFALSAIIGLSLSACGSSKSTFQKSPDVSRGEAEGRGGLGLNLFANTKADGSEGAVAVNAFLWRASLDTVAFMPVASADPFGGVIITDWYAPPETPDERFKVNVYVLGRALRADGLKISVFRQTKDSAGRWTDATVAAEVPTEFEDAVLTRARQLRLQAVSEKG